MERECRPTRDFMRNIANKILGQALEKVPANIVSDLREKLGRLEDKYDFSLYGGRPERLAEALSSPEWRDLVDYAEKLNVVWILHRILEAAAEAYKPCPEVWEKILSEAKKLAAKQQGKGEELTLQTVYRSLKYRGFKVEPGDEGEIIVEEANIRARITVSNGRINYELCKRGKASTIEGFLVKLEKLREL